MSWAERMDQAPTTGAKLRVLAEAMDTLEMAKVHRRNAHRREVRERWAGMAERQFDRHLESADTRRIFEHWVKRMDKPKAKLTEDRRTKIKARLKQGYSVEFILRAIDGCASSDFHMGREYPGQTQHNDLTLICRNGSKLEWFEAMKRAEVDPDAFLGESA